MKTRRKILPFLFVTPHLIIFLIFSLIPIIYGLYISFTKWNFLGTPEWVGLANYKEILFSTESTYYRQFMNGLKTHSLRWCLMCRPVSSCLFGTGTGSECKGQGSKFFSVRFLSAVPFILISCFHHMDSDFE